MVGDGEATLALRRRVALLRGINLGSGRRLPMPALRAVAGGLGWTEVSSLLHTGNLLFLAPGAPAELAAALSAALASEQGLVSDVIVRDGPRLRQLLDRHPARDADPSRAVIACYDRELSDAQRAGLEGCAQAGEVLLFDGADALAWFPEGQARSRLAAALVSSVRPATGTARNLRTIAALVDLLDS